MKDYSPEALAAMADGSAIPTGAAAFYCGDDPAFVWGGPGPITLDGDTYVGMDDSGIAQIRVGAIGGSEQNIEIVLSGVQPEALALLQQAELQRAAVKIYELIFDGSGTRLLHYRVAKRGRLDDAVIEDMVGGTATVKLVIEASARGLGRSGKRMRSDADQRLIDPDDGFFKHVSYAGKKTIYDGGKPSSAATTATGG